MVGLALFRVTTSMCWWWPCARLSTLWFVLVLIPGVQIIAAILVNVEVAAVWPYRGIRPGAGIVGLRFLPHSGPGGLEYQT